MKERIRRAENNLDRVQEWIKAVDQKINMFLALQGIILTLLIPNYLKTITARFQTQTISLWDALFIILATVCLGIAIFQSLVAVFPRLSNKIGSLLYFGSIKNMTANSYRAAMENLTESVYLKDLHEQIFINSRIAARKHEHFQISIILFLIGIGFLIITYLSFKFL